jgi:hypothetical protein
MAVGGSDALIQDNAPKRLSRRDRIEEQAPRGAHMIEEDRDHIDHCVHGPYTSGDAAE